MTGVSAGKKQATVKWKKTTGATSYTVYYALGNGKFKAAGTTDKTSFTVKKLTSKKTYRFKVLANKKVGKVTVKSSYSKTYSCKIK